MARKKKEVYHVKLLTEGKKNIISALIDEYDCFLQVQIPEICRQKWRILHLRFGESCRLPGRIT